MTVAIRDTAFAKYLKTLPKEAAVRYLFECMSVGSHHDNMAWELWDEVHGSKELRGATLHEDLAVVVDSLGVPMNCEECGRDCAEYESKTDFAEWQETGHCDECSGRLYREQQAELRALPY